eukprot:COSAG01_NODE_2030_length_8590_cov_20.238017_4_plen_120_part_00
MCVCENNKHNDPNSCSHYGLEKNDLFPYFPGSGSMSAVVPDRATRDAVGVVCVAGCGSPSVFGVTVSLVQSAGACRVTMHTSAACRSYSAWLSFVKSTCCVWGRMGSGTHFLGQNGFIL